jgi:hypothetical protein
MTDEITKQLAKTHDLRVQVKAEKDRMHIQCASMEGSSLTLKPGEYLEITMVNESVVMTRKPYLVTCTPAPIVDLEPEVLSASMQLRVGTKDDE